MENDLLIVSTEEAIAMCEEALAVLKPYKSQEDALIAKLLASDWENYHAEEAAAEEYMFLEYGIKNTRVVDYFTFPRERTRLIKPCIEDLKHVLDMCNKASGQFGLSSATLSHLNFANKEDIENYLAYERYEPNKFYQEKLLEKKEELAAKEVELLNWVQIKPEGPETILTNNSNLDKPDEGPPEKVITAVESFLLIGGIIFLVALVAGWFV